VLLALGVSTAKPSIHADEYQSAPISGELNPYLAQRPADLPAVEAPKPAPPEAESEASEDAMTPELQAILARLDALEKAAAEKAESKTAEKKPEEKLAEKSESKEPEWIDMSAEKWNVKLGGHVQIDWINWPDHSPQIPADNYVEFRRLRLLADGTGYGVYEFRLQIDIEPESGDGVATPVTDVKDAYFNINHLPVFDRWRIGNFFVPFSLEQVTNDTNNIFMERSIPTQGIFAADRELGMALYGVNDAMDFTYTGGVFFDGISESLKERIDDNQGQRLSGRLTWLPYYDEPSNGRYLVHLGTGVLYTNDFDDLVRFRARPQIHEGPFLIDTGNIPAGSYITGNLEFATVWGPFSVQSEAFLSNVNRIGVPSDNVGGAYVYGSWFLTGENRIYERFGQHGAQFGRNVPYSNFFLIPGCVGPGAWEAKCRWSNLTLTELDSGEYNDLTCGFNWYWSDRVRCMFDWIHPVTQAGTTPFGATQSDIIAMRFDFNW
jgi:phosphate-selective porin OprO/OprP